MGDHEAQLPGRVGCFCNESQAAGLAVEPVDERDPGAVHYFEDQETLQFVPEGIRSSRTCGMNEEICGFVNRQKPVIFVDNT